MKTKEWWALLAMLPLTVVAQTPPQQADRVFINGTIWTADDARPIAQALAGLTTSYRD